MDIYKRCKLITNNMLISNNGLGYDNELDLGIYNELKDEIINKLELLIEPIYKEYAIIKKKQLYDKYGIKFEVTLIDDLLKLSMNKHIEIDKYLNMLNDVNEKIASLNKTLEENK